MGVGIHYQQKLYVFHVYVAFIYDFGRGKSSVSV